MKYLRIACIICLFFNRLSAQDFLNNDLLGIVGTSNLPTSWQNVPFTDANCLASNVGVDTPDVTDLNGPMPTNGVMGYPYSGTTFVSGLMGGPNPGFFYHEGIMQEVSGFTIGECYTVNFHQSVVKQAQTDFLDTSGSWAVYLDYDLIGISTPTVSNEPYMSTALSWEFRSISFIATSTTHTVKFLPADDDTDQSTDNPFGGLRMGIDSVYLGNTANVSLVLDLGNDTILCPGQTLLLDATTDSGSYLWQDSSMNSTLTLTQEGIYWVEATNSCGSVKDTIQVYFYQSPSVHLGNDTILCPGETLLLAANSFNSYLWQDNSNWPDFLVIEDGTYWVTADYQCGSDTDTIIVIYSSVPEVNLGEDVNICEGELLNLEVSSTPNTSYLWNDDSFGTGIIINQEGIYWVQVATACGIATDSLIVQITLSPTIDLGADLTLCNEQSIVLDASTENANYLWLDNSTQPTLSVTQPGVYWVVVNTDCGSAIDSILVTLQPDPVIDLGANIGLCEEETLLLEAGSNASYLWQDGSTASSFLVTQPGTYWVEFTTVCSAIDTIVISEVICQVNLEIPNVITPNGDGFNDYFTPIVSEGIFNMTTEIFNRWGRKVFKSDNLLIGWAPNNTSDGVYYWIIKYEDLNGIESSRNGYLIVLK